MRGNRGVIRAISVGDGQPVLDKEDPEELLLNRRGLCYLFIYF